MNDFTITPIGHFKCDHIYPQLAPRQGTLKAKGQTGFVHLLPKNNFEQALEDLQTFDRIWLLYIFDRNENWKPKVNTPRGEGKRGVFATRAPYRPNQIGMSCVKLKQVTGLILEVEDFDLLDRTPIIDIKPYLNYADSFPDASMGWLDDHTHAIYEIDYSKRASEKIEWIREHSSFDLRTFIEAQLMEDPTDRKRKRITTINEDMYLYEIAARTWRITFQLNNDTEFVFIKDIRSGYSSKELFSEGDTYNDKSVHVEFDRLYPPV